MRSAIINSLVVNWVVIGIGEGIHIKQITSAHVTTNK